MKKSPAGQDRWAAGIVTSDHVKSRQVPPPVRHVLPSSRTTRYELIVGAADGKSSERRATRRVVIDDDASMSTLRCLDIGKVIREVLGPGMLGPVLNGIEAIADVFTLPSGTEGANERRRARGLYRRRRSRGARSHRGPPYVGWSPGDNLSNGPGVSRWPTPGCARVSRSRCALAPVKRA